jgi:hypothetical protein
MIMIARYNSSQGDDKLQQLISYYIPNSTSVKGTSTLRLYPQTVISCVLDKNKKILLFKQKAAVNSCFVDMPCGLRKSIDIMECRDLRMSQKLRCLIKRLVHRLTGEAVV